MLAAPAEFGRGEQAVDDLVVPPDAIIDELTIAFPTMPTIHGLRGTGIPAGPNRAISGHF
jgi:hypothetical protein